MEDRKTLKMVLKELGLDKVYCSCGKTINVIPAVESVFDRIRELCKIGIVVHIRRFGKFRAIKTKRRKINSHLAGKTCVVKSSLTLKYYQTKAAKKLLNEKRKKNGD